MICCFEWSHREFSGSISSGSRRNPSSLNCTTETFMNEMNHSVCLPLIIPSNLVVSTVLLFRAWAPPCARFDGLWWGDYHRIRVSLLIANHFLASISICCLSCQYSCRCFFRFATAAKKKLRRKVKHIFSLMTADVSIVRYDGDWKWVLFVTFSLVIDAHCLDGFQ